MRERAGSICSVVLVLTLATVRERATFVVCKWVQIVRGPRPKSEKWPRVGQQFRQFAQQSQPAAVRPPESQGKTSGMRPFQDPSAKVVEAKERVLKLETALAAMEGMDQRWIWCEPPTAIALPRRLAERLPGVLSIPEQGWQHDASSIVEQHFLNSSIWPNWFQESEHCCALKVVLCQGSRSRLCQFLLRFGSTPTCSESSSCGDFAFLFPCLLTLAGVAVLSTALATTAQVVRGQVLGRRGFALESATARVCREAGARVSTNIFLRDLDLLGIPATDQRRIEVIAEGLPAFHGAQLAIDTTLVSPVRADGAPHQRCSEENGGGFECSSMP